MSASVTRGGARPQAWHAEDAHRQEIVGQLAEQVVADAGRDGKLVSRRYAVLLYRKHKHDALALVSVGSGYTTQRRRVCPHLGNDQIRKRLGKAGDER